MKKTYAKNELLGDYLTSLLVAFVIALVFSPLMYKIRPISIFILIPGSAFLFGTSFFLIGTVRSRIRFRSFLMNVLAQTALMATTITICFFLIIWYFVAFDARAQHATANVLQITTSFVFSKSFIPYEIGGLVLAGLINFFFAFGRKLGPGVMFSWITGKYYTPREEELVFMFLDMKDSTMLAEKLGAIKFSGLVRDFFRDMTIPLVEAKGRVSHYIGDEAVLYWKTKDALDPKGCVTFFKRFEKTIAQQAGYYQKEYGLVPEFKAGAHIGPVVATEVGEVKSEIVFHGDVLNTAARIQGMCNETGEKLLFSKSLASKLKLPEGAIMSALGSVKLKGKAEEIELVAIEST